MATSPPMSSARAGARRAKVCPPSPPISAARWVSPLSGERAVRGRPAKMRSELGCGVTAGGGAGRYQDLLDAYVVDHADATEASKLGIPVPLAHPLMTTLADREELARRVLATAD